METTGTWYRTPGAKREMGIRLRTERDLSTGTSGGSRRVGATSRWTDAPCLGRVGGGEGLQHIELERRQTVTGGEAVGVSPSGRK